MKILKENILSRDEILGEENSSSQDMFNSVDPEIKTIIKEILKSLKVGGAATTAKLDIPPPNRFDDEILSLAIEKLLLKYFKVEVPHNLMMELRQGSSIAFEHRLNLDLPVRKIGVRLEPEYRQILIEGAPPEHGRDGHSELHFNWQQKAGVLDERGNIDLKKVNKLPVIKKDELVARIFMKTNGNPGITCYGKRLKQSYGIPLKIKWDDATVERVDNQEDLTIFDLYAKSAGIVQFSLLEKQNPRTLWKVGIVKTVTINGDVDYSVGDQGSIDDPEMQCMSNLVVTGSVRGVFSLQSNGFIHVKEAIEGKSVVAENVKTKLITRGCKVVAKKEIWAGSIVNANATADKIVIKKNSSESNLKAHELLTFDKGSCCLGLNVITKKLKSSHNTYSGVNRFVLGQEQINRVKELNKSMLSLQEEGSEMLPPIKEKAQLTFSHLALVEEITRKKSTKQTNKIRALVTGLIKNLSATFQQPTRSIAQDDVKNCYELQALMSEDGYDNSVLRKVDLLIAAIQNYNADQGELAILYNNITDIKNTINRQRSYLTDELLLEFDSIKFAGPNAELLIQCGESVLRLNHENLQQKTFHVRYELNETEDDLARGKLLLNYGISAVSSSEEF